MLKQTLLLTSLALIVAAPAAYADTVTDSGDNVAYTLDYTATSTPGVYDVFLTIDASAYDGNSKTYPDYLNSIGIQLAPSTSDYSISVISAPAGDYTDPFVASKLSASGCGASGSGFYCLAYTGAGLGLPVGYAGDVYDFEFSVTALNGFGKDGLYTGDQSNVEANYEWLNTKTDAVGDQLDNEAISLTPEPSSLALLGTGILAGFGALRRRRKA